jgi:hypothetical protein
MESLFVEGVSEHYSDEFQLQLRDPPPPYESVTVQENPSEPPPTYQDALCGSIHVINDSQK